MKKQLNTLREFDLDNGTHVVFLPTPGFRTATLECIFRGGYLAEHASTRGALHLYEHLIHNGNSHHDNHYELDLALEQYGVRSEGAFTGPETMGIRYHLPLTSLPSVLEYLYYYFFEPNFSNQTLEREKKIVWQEKQEKFRSPEMRFYRTMDERYYGKDHPYAWFDALGTEETIQVINMDAIHTIQQQFLVGSNLVIGIACDCSETEILHQLSSFFGRIPVGKPVMYTHHPASSSKKSSVIIHDSVRRCELLWYVPYGGVTSKTQEELTIGNMIDYVLGSSSLSLLFQALRYKQQLSYRFRVYPTLWPHDGVRSVWVSTDPDKKDVVQRVVCDEISHLITQGLDPKLFSALKTQFTFFKEMELDFPHAILSRGVSDYLEYHQIFSPNELLDMVKEITLQHCNELAVSIWSKFNQGLFGLLVPNE